MNGASDSADAYPPGHPRVGVAYVLKRAAAIAHEVNSRKPDEVCTEHDPMTGLISMLRR